MFENMNTIQILYQCEDALEKFFAEEQRKGITPYTKGWFEGSLLTLGFLIRIFALKEKDNDNQRGS